MQLICPSCSAEYQVSADAIGAKGRMVRCAACSSEWFQTPEAKSQGAAQAAAPSPMSAAAPEQDVEEVEAPRAFDRRGSSGFEDGTSPTDRDATPTYRAQPVTDDRFADLGPSASSTGQVYFDAEPAVRPASPPPVVEETAIRSRRNADIDTFTSSLRAEEDEAPPRTGGAFLAGFATTTLLSLILIAVYVKAPEIAAIAPVMEGPLAMYASMVDQGRVAITGTITGG